MTRRNKIIALVIATSIVLGVAGYFVLPMFMRTAADEPPLNFVAVAPRLGTAGQPSRAQFERLRAQGYEVVINLAPADSYGSLADEGAVVTRAGMMYVQIPVDWDRPRIEDIRQFSDIMNANRGRKVLVHCQMNLRASTFVFLHRVLEEKAEMDDAFDSVTAVWAPNPTWAAFIRDTLKPRQPPFGL